MSTKLQHQSIELKLANIVQILRKIRYIIKIFKHSIVIYIDYTIALDIACQISLTITFTNKLNLRLIRASNYLQQFNLDIYYKSSKQYIVSNALSRLISNNRIAITFLRFFYTKDCNKLNALFAILAQNILFQHFLTLLKQLFTNNCKFKKSFVDISRLLPKSFTNNCDKLDVFLAMSTNNALSQYLSTLSRQLFANNYKF